MELDALKGFGKGFDKSKGKGSKGKNDKGKAKGKGKDDQNKDAKVKCFYCGKLGHRKEDCRKRAADLKKAKAEGKPSVSSELSTTPTEAAPTQMQALLDHTRDVDVLFLCSCAVGNAQKKMHMHGFVLLDSGAAVST